MICTKCNATNNNDAKFCTYCGNNLKSTQAKMLEGSVDMYFMHQDKVLTKEANKVADDVIKRGLIAIAIGLGITFVTWLFASEGDTYYVFWGLVIYGVYIVLKGLYYKANPKSLINETKKKENQK